ncbi:unnamed protein product [Bursaphelenchus okinawaensis]|uniref:Uncharacterized protein n=1 Tax=Bursaphelenchus okinawaensis TaxID=465554 RepID=A0A811KSQ7_9BILA|nr:unnamed protein product [Bursaphelenchus okinawaensis]CAG9110699.1 unnamed protein product [Bursaphelenchus okinawaensis]
MDQLKFKPLINGSPGMALDRFYRDPTPEEEKQFNLLNLKHLFEDPKSTGHRKRCRSIWSTDGEEEESPENSFTTSPVVQPEPFTFIPPQMQQQSQIQQQPLKLMNPELRRLYSQTQVEPIFAAPDRQYESMHNPDLKRFYAPPDASDERVFNLRGLSTIFCQQ